MTTLKPDGLIIPDCHCFKTKLQAMNNQIDVMSCIHALEAVALGDKMQICLEAREYFISVFISDLLMNLLTKDDKNENGSLDTYQQEYSNIYDRIKPMVMQRLSYAEGRLMEYGKE